MDDLRATLFDITLGRGTAVALALLLGTALLLVVPVGAGVLAGTFALQVLLGGPPNGGPPPVEGWALDGSPVAGEIPAAHRAVMEATPARWCPGLPWQVLAAIARIESGFGRNMGPSSAGAVGYMQFLPATWAAYGVDGDGDGDRDPRDYRDAIPAAARYLCASGAPGDLSGALWAYNHADWYVAQVLEQARAYTAEPAPAGPLGPGLPGLPAPPGSLAAIPRIGQGDPAEYDAAYPVRSWACCTCSAASLTAVARGFGRPVRIADTMRLMPGAITTRRGLVNRPALVGAARALGFAATDDVIGYEHLRAATAAGQPVLLDITNVSFPGGHWLVVTGVGDDGVRVVDSAGTRLTFIARSTFVPSWSGRGIRLAA